MFKDDVRNYGIYRYENNEGFYEGEFDSDGLYPVGTVIKFNEGNTLEIKLDREGNKQRVFTNKKGFQHVQTYEYRDQIIFADHSLLNNTQKLNLNPEPSCEIIEKLD